MYQAARAQRNELRSQLGDLQERRSELTQALTNGLPEAQRKGIENQLVIVDQRIAEVDKALGEAERQLAQTAGVPGAVVPEPQSFRDRGPPESVMVLSVIFMFAVLVPISIAFTRRIWKRGTTAVATFPAELFQRLERLEQGMDSIAVEVERIGEGQRFATRLFAESRALNAGNAPAQPIEVKHGAEARAP